MASAERSEIMRRVHGKDTGPELRVRRLLHGMGYRYRLHAAHLPGKPDLVFPSRKKVIFVHGCFWHRHPRCKRASTPATNAEYWQQKFRRNVERDRRNQQDLEELGWSSKVIWECELKDLPALSEVLVDFLETSPQ